MYFIHIQTIDYDDYPIGEGMKIGPFESDVAAAEWAKARPQTFYAEGYTWEWRFIKWTGRHTIQIKSVTRDLTSPEYFDSLYV